MENHPVNKKSFIHYIFIVLFSLSYMLLFTGCSNMAEIQDRDFGLALGISLTEEQFELTYALPDLSALANESKTDKNESNNGHTRTYIGTTLSEIEDQYNHSSNKILDYRHLEALILDEAMSSSDKLPVLLEYLNNKYEISRDVLVFYYPDDVKKLIEEKGKISGNIGEYLKKLENNNQRKNALPAVTIGNLLDSYYQKKGLVVPLLESTEDKLAVNGAALFQDSVFIKQLTDEQLSIYYVIKGLGKEFNFHTQNGLAFKLKEIDSESRYFYRDNKPVIQLTIKGTAELISVPSDHTDADTEINNYLTDAALNQINTGFKSDKIDYINLYDESSIKNRDVWLSYQNRRTDFINDVVIELNMDIHRH